MKKTVNVTSANKVLNEVNVLDYFKLGKDSYLLYERVGEPGNSVYLAKYDENLLIKPEDTEKEQLQNVMKYLITNNSSIDVKKYHYKKLSIDKIEDNINEKEANKISLTDEQYRTLIENLNNSDSTKVKPVKVKEPKTGKQLNKKAIIIVSGIVVVVAILVVLLLVVLPKGGLIGSSKSEFNIKFDTDGSTLYGDMIIKNGEEIDVSSYTPSKEGYMFGGWYTDAKFKNAVSGVYKPTDDTTFYAKWEKNTCTGNCRPGQMVTLEDGSTWYTIETTDDNSKTIRLLASSCNDLSLKFDDKENDYNKSSIKQYVENDYLNSLGDLKSKITDVRLMTKEEVEILQGMDNASNWLYNTTVCPYGNWWTMASYETDQAYIVNSKGLAEPYQQLAEGVVSKNGTVSNLAGLRPVITIDKSAIRGE